MGPGRDRELGEIGILFEKTGVPGPGAQIDQTDVIGLGRHDDRTTRKGSKEPEGVELFVAKSGCRVVIPHGVAFDPVPDAEVIKKQFTVWRRLLNQHFPLQLFFQPDLPDF